MTFIYKMNLIKLSQEEKLPAKWNEAAESLGLQISKTPLNVGLIPDGLTNPKGTYGYSGTATESNMSAGPASISVKSLFSSSTQTVSFGSKTSAAATVWYILDEDQYNGGFFDPGVYQFQLHYDKESSYGNLAIQGWIAIMLEDGTWQKLHKVNHGYPQTPYDSIDTFEVTTKFKGIKYIKANFNNYNHSRRYWVRNAQLTRIS